MLFRVLVFSGIVSVCRCACAYPSDLIGEWYSTSFGTLNFNNQSFSGFTSDLSSAPLTFTCHLSSGNRYVSIASYALLSSVNVDTYLCMDIERISSIKYVYTLNSDKDTGTGIRFYTPTSGGAGSATLDEACSYTDTRSPGEYELLIKKDQIDNAVSTCPGSLQTTFDVTMTTDSVSDCNGTQMVGSNAVLDFQYSSCVTGIFNTGSVLQCLYSKTSGYNYVTLYNNDSITDGVTSFMFSCLTFSKTEARLRATENPSVCHTGQTPTSVDSPGIRYTMTDRLYTPSEEKDYTVVIIVCSILGAIVILTIIAIVLYITVFRKPRPPTPAKIRKRRHKPSVTEYTPRILGRSSSVEKEMDEPPCKMSAGEIITGIYVEKRLSNMSLDNLDAYKPPKKEVWQKKWETDLHPTTPRLSKEALKHSKVAFPSIDQFSQDKDMSVTDLDKAFTMSTSLPDSLDYHSAKSSSRQASRQMKDFGRSSAETLDTTELPKYSERSHATSKMPESTGKFGSTVCIPSSDPAVVSSEDSRLDPITENPLSRENTSMTKSQKDNRLKRLQQNLLRVRNGHVSMLTTPVSASEGTASEEWQYKWETVLRPKSGQSDIKRTRRSHSPASLFQKSNVVPKSSKWKLLKARLQNKFGGNKVSNLDNLETVKAEDKMPAETHFTVTNLKIENEIVERKSPESRIPNRSENEQQADERDIVVRKKSSYKKRRDSLELLREGMHHLRSTSTTPDLPSQSATTTPDITVSRTSSVNSLNELSTEDGRVSVNSTDKANETDKTVEDASDVKALFLTPKDAGIIKNANFDTVSIHTELFYPDEWIYDSCAGLQELWDLCSKTTASTRRREYKQYVKYTTDEELALKKDKRKRERHTFKSIDEQKLDVSK